MRAVRIWADGKIEPFECNCEKWSNVLVHDGGQFKRERYFLMFSPARDELSYDGDKRGTWVYIEQPESVYKLHMRPSLSESKP